MKKGFTLVELLAAIILLGAISLLIVPIINDEIEESREKAYNVQIEEIKKAASDWAINNTSLLPIVENDTITINLNTLKQADLIQMDIKDPRTSELFPNVNITISRYSNNYIYYVSEDAIVDEIYDKSSPIIILNGNILEYAEVTNSLQYYTDKGATAYSSNGSNITDLIQVTYKKNDDIIGSLATNEFSTYTVTYTVNDVINNVSHVSTMIRTVMVRDTTSPQLTIPNNITLTLAQLQSFDIYDGVTIIDNDPTVLSFNINNNCTQNNLCLTVEGMKNEVGKHVLTYNATDLKGNTTTLKRIVEINN